MRGLAGSQARTTHVCEKIGTFFGGLVLTPHKNYMVDDTQVCTNTHVFWGGGGVCSFNTRNVNF